MHSIGLWNADDRRARRWIERTGLIMEAQHQEQSASASEAEIARKPYQAPTVVPWGSLRDVTRSVAAQGASDGGSKSNKRGTR
jgi:hypothetical protein